MAAFAGDVSVSVAGLIVMTTEPSTVAAVGVVESVACTVTVDVPEVAGVPLREQLPASEMPPGSVPLLSVQL